nr:5'-3' exonuclease H3TH domain-containing protein [uncultured Schaedlerella sp.]
MSDTYEADDLAGTLAGKYRESMTVRLVSKDRDYLQLVSNEYDVRLWVPASEKDAEDARKGASLYTGDSFTVPDFMKHFIEYTDQAVYADKGVYPGNIPDLKAIEGDSSDNIPGVKGVSSAAAPLIGDTEEWKGIYEAIDSCGGDAKQEKELADFWKTALSISRSPVNALKRDREMAFLSLDLATIRTYCDEALDFNLEASPVKDADFKKLNGKLLDLGIKNARFEE